MVLVEWRVAGARLVDTGGQTKMPPGGSCLKPLDLVSPKSDPSVSGSAPYGLGLGKAGPTAPGLRQLRGR